MSNYGIKFKLAIITSILSFGIILVSVLGYTIATSLSSNINNVIENSLPIIRNITLVDMVHDGVRGSVLQALLGASTKDASKIQEAESTLKEHKDNMEEYFKTLFSKKLPPELMTKLDKNHKEINDYIESANLVINTAKESPDKLNPVWNNFQAKFSQLEESLKNFADEVENNNDKYFSDLVKQNKFYLNILIMLFITTLVFGLIFSFKISNNLISLLKKISYSVHNQASKIGEYSKLTSLAAQDLSKASQEQSAAIEKTSSAVEEISGMLSKASDIAIEAESFSHHSIKKVQKGNEIIKNMVDSMDKIDTNNNEIANYMLDNNKKTSDILDIIKEVNSKTKVINDIVFQTKILSFNASVEAARAGEQGKGFAVVAEEVGNLAQMSGAAAEEINVLLNNSLNTVSGIVEDTKIKVQSMIKQSKTTVENGKHVTLECEDILKELTAFVHKITESISTITNANKESSKGAQEIAAAMNQLTNSTHLNNNSAVKSSQNSEELSHKMIELKSVANDLNFIIMGQSI